MKSSRAGALFATSISPHLFDITLTTTSTVLAVGRGFTEKERKMRLIDADALITMCEKSLEYAERCLHAQTSDFGNLIMLSSVQTWKFMIEILEEEAPTVNAIPVNYIQDRIDSLQELAEYELEANGGYTGQVHTEVYALRRLINYWKGEQSAKSK